MSFGWLGVFREGSWRAFRKFLLHEARDAPKRIDVINAELERIGQITVIYANEILGDDQTRTTERRTGLIVTPGSSLEKLLQAYIAQGGNPFDISMFLQPDTTLTLSQEGREDFSLEPYPYGGILAPRTVDFAGDGPYDGGFLPALKYLPSRLGSREVIWDKTVPIVEFTDAAQRWARKEIRHKRNNIESRIIKLCDLREQLIHERDELIEQAVGDFIVGIPFREEYFSESRRLLRLLHEFDRVFYGLDRDARLDFDIPSLVDRVSGRYQTLLDNAETGEEDWTAL